MRWALHQLDDELRPELRAPQRTVRQLRSIGQACIRALRAIEMLAGADV